MVDKLLIINSNNTVNINDNILILNGNAYSNAWTFVNAELPIISISLGVQIKSFVLYLADSITPKPNSKTITLCMFSGRVEQNYA